MKKKPNILFFLTDDQRFDTIHALGCDEIYTPNLDMFSKESVVFTHAHIIGGTCGAVCMPSRSMIQTGRNLFNLYGTGKKNGAVIPPEHITLPECLKANGYHTCHIGKWHQNRESFHRCYDEAERIMGFHTGGSYGYHFSTVLFNYDPTGAYEMEKAYNVGPNHELRPVDFTRGGMHSTDIFTDAAIDFIHDYDRQEPFYLYVALHAPHDPRQCPEKYEEMYSSETVSCPPNFKEHHPFDNGDLGTRDEMLETFPRRKHAIRRHIADYYAMISHNDDRFGEVKLILMK